MPSTELVSFTGHRKAWNTIHGTELSAHDGLLNAEQASEINRKYDIEVYVGPHGRGFDPEDPDARRYMMPSEIEYSEVAAVIGAMQPGDTLLIEAQNFYDNHKNFYGRMRDYAETQGSKFLALIEKQMLDQIQQEREAGTLDAFEYGKQLAEAKGVRVVRADHDAFDVEAARAVSAHMLDPSDQRNPRSTFAINRDARREYAARNIVKDVALEGLSQDIQPEEGYTSGSRKPKLVVLWGSGHMKGLEQAFADSHLDAKLTVMKRTPIEERYHQREKEERNIFLARSMGKRVNEELTSTR